MRTDHFVGFVMLQLFLFDFLPVMLVLCTLKVDPYFIQRLTNSVMHICEGFIIKFNIIIDGNFMEV